jgi:hypothetical protein
VYRGYIDDRGSLNILYLVEDDGILDEWSGKDRLWIEKIVEGGELILRGSVW